MEASSNRTVDVLVSGGSYAGLALAVALADAIDGLRILVIDAQPERNGAASAPPDPRAFALSLSSQRMLETLGIWAQIARVAQPIASIEISDSELEAGVRPTLLKYANDTHEGDAASFIVPGSALTAALEAAVRRHPAISVLRPLGIVRADRDGPAARAVLSDGSTVEAALVVAAEGRRSPLREAAGIKLVGWSYGQLGIVQTIAHELPHNGLAVQHFLPAGPFAMLPLTGNRSCITWSVQEPSARHILALDDTAFLA
ncbi:MAG: FAD-dependent monooxygenase, partial [Hyphomicrobiaceae bacterium]